MGSDELWDRAEAVLEQVVKENSHEYTVNAGDGAFYGPKIDFVVQDVLMRDWQLGTIQLDFNMPERFGLEYRNSQGSASRPVMIHRAVLGSLERFIGILIEHYGGAFPLWLSPVQISLIPVAEPHANYAHAIVRDLQQAGYRVELQTASETLGARIRKSQTEKIPYMLVMGDKEIEAKKIAIRSRVKGDLGQKTVEEFLGQLKQENKPTTMGVS